MSAGKQPQMYLTPGIICHCSEVTNVYFLFGRQTKFDFFCTLKIPCLTILVKFSFNDHIMTADISLVLISAFCGVYFLDYVHPKVLLILIISDLSLPSAVYLLPHVKNIAYVSGCGTKILHCALPPDMGSKEISKEIIICWRIKTIWKHDLKLDLRSQKVKLHKPYRAI